MKDMEEQIQQHFQMYKGVGVLMSLALILLFQTLLPNRRRLQDLVGIW